MKLKKKLAIYFTYATYNAILFLYKSLVLFLLFLLYIAIISINIAEIQFLIHLNPFLESRETLGSCVDRLLII